MVPSGGLLWLDRLALFALARVACVLAGVLALALVLRPVGPGRKRRVPWSVKREDAP